jgi:hypothetical protein
MICLQWSELAGCPSTHFVNDGWIKLHKSITWDMLAGASLQEQGVERIIADADRLVVLSSCLMAPAVRLDAVLDA